MNPFFTTHKTGGIKLDPRTKLAILIMTSVFVLGGAGGDTSIMVFVRPLLTLISIFLLLGNKQYLLIFIGTIFYLLCYAAQYFLLPITTGLVNFSILFLTGIFTRFIPGILAAHYLLSTTTVSEFMAGLQKLRISENIIIPLLIVFRFFPTVLEEAHHVNQAMRMQGIRFGGGKFSKMLEYRLIPILACSIQIGEDLSAAALTRGLGAPVRRTNICDIGFHVQDMILLAFFLIVILYQCAQLFGYVL